MIYNILFIALGVVVVEALLYLKRYNRYKKLWLETSFAMNGGIIKATTLKYGIFYSDVISLYKNPLGWVRPDGVKVDKELAATLTRLYLSAILIQDFFKKHEQPAEEPKEQVSTKKKSGILH